MQCRPRWEVRIRRACAQSALIPTTSCHDHETRQTSSPPYPFAHQCAPQPSRSPRSLRPGAAPSQAGL
eukprot:6173786-Pleurochrysis_carterae.AAC.3